MNDLFSPLTVAGLYHGDSRDVLKTLPDNSIDSVVTDPPYALVSIVKRFGGKNAAPAKSGVSGVYARASAGFMGQSWDTGEVAFAAEFWSEVYRVLKPGGHVVSFGGTRTYHRMTCAIEDAGFEIRDQLQWLYGTGFPKSHDVSKAIDRAAGAEREVVGTGRSGANAGMQDLGPSGIKGGDYDITKPATAEAEQWEGWGTALKPANEPICLARKPLDGTVAENVLKWGTGAINIDGCRIELSDSETPYSYPNGRGGKAIHGGGQDVSKPAESNPLGRFPANVITDGSVEMPNGAQRFFYCAKASRKDRNEGLEDPGPQFKHGSTLRMIENTTTKGNNHPTVKPTDLMRYLCRLVTPPGGIVLDPFMGSGSTGKAARLEGFQFVGIEREEQYFKIAQTRCT